MEKRIGVGFGRGFWLLLAGISACVPERAVLPADAGAALPADAAVDAGCAGDACRDDATVCTDGACTSPCAEGLLDCGGACVDLERDRDHCGSCDHACTEDQRCSAGQCSACTARTLTGPLPLAVEFDTRGGGDLLQGSCGTGTAEELAFAWRAPHAGKFLFSTAGSRFNTVLYVRAGSCDGSELGCSDDRADALSSRLELDLSQDEAVVVVVDGYEGQSGQAELHIEELSASSCCTAGSEPGCGLSPVEACVCAVDAFCCSLAWDDVCVALVAEHGCGACAEAAPAACEAGSRAEQPDALAGAIDSTDRAEASCGGPAGTPDALFAFVAPAAGTYSFDTDGSAVADTVLAVIDGGACSGEELACNDDNADQLSARVRLPLASGQEVLVLVEGWEGEQGDVALAITRDAEAERCAASPMDGAVPLAVEGTVSWDASALEPSCALFGSAGEALFAFTAPAAGRYRFDTAGSTADTILQLLEGDCAGAELACNDDPDDTSLAAALELPLAAAQTVLVNVDSVIGEGDYVLTVTRVPAAL